MEPLTPKAKNLLRTVAVATPTLMLLFELASGGQLKDYLDKDIVRAVIFRVFEWGPGFLILFGAFLIIREYMPQLIEAQRSQARAITSLAEGVMQLNQDTHDAIEERREILITLKVIKRQLDEIQRDREERRHG